MALDIDCIPEIWLYKYLYFVLYHGTKCHGHVKVRTKSTCLSIYKWLLKSDSCYGWGYNIISLSGIGSVEQGSLSICACAGYLVSIICQIASNSVLVCLVVLLLNISINYCVFLIKILDFNIVLFNFSLPQYKIFLSN